MKDFVSLDILFRLIPAGLERIIHESFRGKVDSTSHRCPLTMEAYIAVKDKTKAIELEQGRLTGHSPVCLIS